VILNCGYSKFCIVRFTIWSRVIHKI